ncbi:MAG: RNA polymerase sigma factor [Bacteroidales bacterium]
MEIKQNFADRKKRDYVLVQKALENKDQGAFAELLNLYYEPLYHYLLQKTRNVEDADDLAIESFSKAFCNLDKYVDTHSFSTWLFRIANNNFIDFYRKRNRYREIDSNKMISCQDEEVCVDIPSSGLDPEEVYITKEKYKELRRVVKELKKDYRDIIEMRFFKELSYEEIQEKTNLPMGTLKAKLFRARILLMSLFERYEEDLGAE